MTSEPIESDVRAVLSHRHDNGADFWATPDDRIYVGNPYSTISSLVILHELGVGREHEAVAGGIELILDAIRDDGRVRVAPKAPMYPCYTAEAVRSLCRFGMADDPRVRPPLDYLLGTMHETGGWRCSFSRFGKGPETQCGSPGATLYALDALRFLGPRPDVSVVSEEVRERIDRAVELLLGHWEVRTPIGPCHHGIGSRFLQAEYPFIRYNLFYYVYVLSFFERSKRDPRFEAALAELETKLTDDGRLIVENPHRGLGELALCARGQASDLATGRYEELKRNLA